MTAAVIPARETKASARIWTSEHVAGSEIAVAEP
jgi:hypothetical protein